MSDLELVSKEITELPTEEALINPEVAIEPSIPDTDSVLKGKLVFTFKDYNIRQCEVKDLQKREAKELMERFKEISGIDLKDLPQRKIIRDNVENAGNYSSLYSDLPEDVELKEIDYNKQGRIFGYLVDRYFCVVAIKSKHIK